jgi:tetratricopeptide (TPR) repeat protein
VRAALWAILALAALVIVVLLGVVIVRAARSDALVVQPFDVPPALEAKGLTGKVVATQVLDKLAELQVQSESTRPAASYATNWGDELKIDIPNTGATADQLWRLLRSGLGKETRISGEVINTGEGLALTARSGSEPGRRFVSASNDLSPLIQQAAELIYKSTQPYRYAVHLFVDPTRTDEAEQVLRRLARDPSPVERKWAFNGLSVLMRDARGDPAEGIEMAKRALAIDPQLLPSLNNIGLALYGQGREQEMVDAFEKAALVSGKDYDPIVVQGNDALNRAKIALAKRDPWALSEAAERLAASPTSMGLQAPIVAAEAALLRHEAPVLPARSDIPGLTRLKLRSEIERGVSPALQKALVADEIDATATLESLPKGATERRAVNNDNAIFSWPLRAEALSMLGKHDEAKALISRTATDCYTCLRVRGLVSQRRGEASEAQRWFKEAATRSPRLAPAFLDLARLYVERRSMPLAEAHFRKAAELAPNWADPLKYWGDALAGNGRRRDAFEKYSAAMKLAPAWSDLRQAKVRMSAR